MPAAKKDEVRLNHYLALCGVGSRREAERLMAEGVVKVNGALPPKGGCMVTQDDVVTVRGKRVAPQTRPTPRLWVYHKPVGLLVTARDPQGRETIWDHLPTSLNGKKLPRLMTVGRLDALSEGLILLTDDGALAQRLMRPESAIEREYRVRTFGALDQRALDRMALGVVVRGVHYQGVRVWAEDDDPKLAKRKKPRAPTESKKNHWYRFVLTEGKNREIRKLVGHFGGTVNRLVRLRYGMFMLRDLPAGTLVEVPENVVKKMLTEMDKREAKAHAGRADDTDY